MSKKNKNVVDADLEAASAVPSSLMALSDEETAIANALGALDALDNADESKFVEEQATFWKPEKVGDSFKGVYLYSDDSERITRHIFATRHRDTGKPFPLSVNGSMKLTQELKKRRHVLGDAPESDPRRICKITFMGKVPSGNLTDEGTPKQLNQFKVEWFKG